MFAKSKFQQIFLLFIFTLFLLLLSRFDMVLFHSVSELVGIIFGINLFIISWNTKTYIKNDFIYSIGIGYLFISILDLFHMLSFPGFMTGHSISVANRSITYWFIARFLESILWLISSFWFKYKLRKEYLFTFFFTITTLLIYLNLQTNILPSLIIENNKASLYKHIGDIVINSILLLSLFQFYSLKTHFNINNFKSLLLALVILTIIGFFFNVYSNQNIRNMLGWHLGKIIAFLILYKTILENGLRKPFSLLFKELKDSKNQLLKHQETLNHVVDVKTESIVKLNHKLEKISKSIHVSIFEIKIINKKLIFTYFSQGTLLNQIINPGSSINLFIDKIDKDYKDSFLRLFDGNLLKEIIFNFKYMKSDNEPLYLKMILTQSGNSFFGVLQDITDEIEKRSLEQQLIKSQKNETIGTMTNTISHDFNNILHGIFSSLEAVVINKEDAKYFKTAFYLIEKGKSLVYKLLKFSSSNESEIKQVSVIDFYNSLELFLKSFLNSKSTVTFKIEDSFLNCFIYIKPIEMDQVFLNLVVNATHASHSDALIDITFSKKKNCLNIDVRDFGKGIPEDVINKIFEPYFTTRKEDNGTGLGLAVVKTIIKNHHGKISVSSELKKGTTFSISLPFEFLANIKNDNKKALIESKTNSVDLNIKKSLLVYLVEDDEMLLELISKQLTSLGYEVMIFGDGYQLLDQIEKKIPDIVVSDYLMPKISGADILQNLREKQIFIPVLIISGFINQDDLSLIKTFQNSTTLNKPFSKIELNNSIKKSIQKMRES